MKTALQNNTSGKPGRRLTGSSMLAFALFGLLGVAQAQTTETTQPAAIKTEASYTSPSPFGPLKQVKAGLLNVAYAETGPADGPVG